MYVRTQTKESSAMSEDKILRRVRALLERAGHPNANEHEATQARETAYDLMARHQIDQALLVESGQASPEGMTSRMIRIPGPYAKNKIGIASVVARHHQCKALITYQGSYVQLQVFGTESDLQAVDMLITQLLLHATRDMHRDGPPGSAQHVKSWRASFLIGFGNEVGRRMEEFRRRAENETAGSERAAVVLADRGKAAEDAMRAEHPNTTRTGGSSSRGRGAGAGRASARSADLGQGKVSGQRQKALR